MWLIIRETWSTRGHSFTWYAIFQWNCASILYHEGLRERQPQPKPLPTPLVDSSYIAEEEGDYQPHGKILCSVWI